MPEYFEDEQDFVAEDTAHSLPLGWLAVFIGLILFGVFYIASYTPVFSGWTQAGAYEAAVDK